MSAVREDGSLTPSLSREREQRGEADPVSPLSRSRERAGGVRVGVAGAVLAKIFVLVFIVVFIQKRPQGLFALKGRSAES